ncbi:hypothetical protein JL49_13530 [Pseudoalteromonas luteoviolacea]|nr:hypothetical protein JL49_13530 [Pseudoalteromonas luteoviolacea]
MELAELERIANANILEEIAALKETVTALQSTIQNIDIAANDCEWMALSLAASRIGKKPSAIYSRIKREKMPEGLVWKKVGGARNSPIYVNLAKYREYLINS